MLAPAWLGRTAVVELIRQAVARGERVLASAASNVAVDNMAVALVAAGISIVRCGRAEAIRPEL